MSTQKHFTVHSSSGEITADKRTGEVRVFELDNEIKDNYLKTIATFDVNDFKEHYKMDMPDDVDILNIGYWLRNGQYSRPALRGEKLEYTIDPTRTVRAPGREHKIIVEVRGGGVQNVYASFGKSRARVVILDWDTNGDEEEDEICKIIKKNLDEDIKEKKMFNIY